MLRRVALIVLFVCAGGCAARSARIDQRLILPQSGDRYSMDDRQLFLMPMSLGNEPPEFPQSLQLHDLPPTTVCAEVTISDTGVVERVTLLRDAEGCGDGAAPLVADLERSVEARLLQWRYEPAAICTFRDAQAMEEADGLCLEKQAKRKPVAVRLAYAFTFEVREGKGRVTRKRVAGN